MDKKRTITIYQELNEPDLESVRENARKTPEELWTIYIGMRRIYREVLGIG